MHSFTHSPCCLFRFPQQQTSQGSQLSTKKTENVCCAPCVLYSAGAYAAKQGLPKCSANTKQPGGQHPVLSQYEQKKKQAHILALQVKALGVA